MPFQNRMLPDGELVAQDWRGTFMGNRGGRIHNPKTQELMKRRSASRRWICCLLAFKERQRTVMGEGYTEVFFLDEVSAFAAGHRPCFECRRKDAVNFQLYWQQAFDLVEKPSADLMDLNLHNERMEKKKDIISSELSNLPNGAMFQSDGRSFAVWEGKALLWTGEGYSLASAPSGVMESLTPTSILAVLSQGYKPDIHFSAKTMGHR